MNPSDKIDSANICSMTENDIADVLRIQAEGGLSPWTRLDYRSEIDNPDSIKKVAKFKNGEDVIGFAIVRLLLGSDESANMYGAAEIYNIAVRQKFQSRGIGQQIFDNILGELKKQKVTEVWLEVRESNRKAINFYQKNGFSKQTVRKLYYKNPAENACILKLSINYENQI